ncbi:hypothetical protein EV122DRAFT_213091 [Schizophyllum commune]
MAPVPIPAASVCFRCQNPGSSPERFMLQCCECKRTWHHTCHAPPVPEKDLIEGIRAFNDNHVENIFTMWTCKRCGKKPKAAQSRAPSSAVDERRATVNAPARPPTGVPAAVVTSQKHASVVPPVQSAVAPLPKYHEPPAPPPLKRDALPKPLATASQASVAEIEARRAPSAQWQPGYSALPIQITTPQPPSRRSDQVNPFAGRLVDTLKGPTSKKSTASKRSAKASVPSAAVSASTLQSTSTSTTLPPTASSGLAAQQRPGPAATSWRPNAPLLQSTASFASSASLASATSSRATSLSSLAINRPHSADGTVIDLGDRLEEMNVDTPDAGSTPHAASPVPCAARTGVGLDEITALLRARPVLPAQVRTLAGPKAPVPGVSLPYEWLSQKKLGAEATHPSSRHAPPQRRSRKMVATKGRMLEPEMLMVGGMVASV